MSAAKPMLKYFLRTRFSPLASSDALKSGNFCSAATRRLDQEREHRELDARLLVFLVERDAQRFEVGDVGIVELRDVRDHHPVAREVGAGDLPDARQRLGFDRAELREVRPAATAAGRAPPARAAAWRAPDARARASARFTNAARPSCEMRPFGPLPVTCARSTPSSRANLRTEGDACAACPGLSATGAGRRASAPPGSFVASRPGVACFVAPSPARGRGLG